MKTLQQQHLPHSGGGGLLTADEALLAFNRIKDLYSAKIEELNELKRQLFSQNSADSQIQMDHQLRSKLRITIESLLIDLNEEVFAISEELAKSFTFERNKNNLGHKAQEFEQRQRMLMKKIKDSIDANPSIRSFRRNQRISSNNNHNSGQNLSPPQRDLNTFGLNTITEVQRNLSYQPLPSNIHHSFKNPSPARDHKRQKLFTSNSAQRLASIGSESKKRKTTTTGSLGDMFENLMNLPPTNNTSGMQRNSLKRKRSPIPLRRKAAVEIQEGQGNNETIQMMRTSHSSTNRGQNNQMSAKKQLIFQEKKSERQPIKKNVKKLEEFERFLAKKTQQTIGSTRHHSNSNKKAQNKENYNLDNNLTDPTSTLALQSEAFELFTQDFGHMKQKLVQILQRLSQNEDHTSTLEDQIQRLKTENLKLATDVKIIRNEHSELMHSVYNIEKKNSQLSQENQILKNMLSGERSLKGQETNMPKQVSNEGRGRSEFNEISMMSEQPQQRKISPFSSFLQRNRSFSNQREQILPPQDQFMNGSSFTNLRNFKLQNDLKNNTQEYQQLNKSILNQSQEIRDFPNQFSGQNPLFSASNERPPTVHLAQNLSYQMLRQPPHHSTQPPRMPSGGPSSLRSEAVQPQLMNNSFNNFNSRTQMTPTTPGSHIDNETPHRVKIGANFTNNHQPHNQQQNTAFLMNNKLTPNSLNSSHMQPADNNSQLSDWVIERMKNK